MALRWRREDYDAVKHDKCFSDWKVLVGPSDWKEQAASREGPERFRPRNLPGPHVGSGVYELGVTLPAWKTEDRYCDNGSIKSEDIVVVYIGHADHIRKRLQRYGQAGAHLEGPRSPNSSTSRKDLSNKSPKTSPAQSPNSAQSEDLHGEEPFMSKSDHRSVSDRETSISGRRSSKIEKRSLNIPNRHNSRAEPVSDHGGRGSPRGPRLFSEVFGLGCSMAYRWSSTKTKEVAEIIVSELTDAFDYAWNRGGDSDVRPQDILQKIVLGKRRHGSNCCSMNSSKWSRLLFKQKVVGIKVLGALKPTATRMRRRSRVDSRGLFMLLRKSPHLMIVGGKSAKHCEFTKIDIPVDRCGVLLENGLVCNALPQKGRKRCQAHFDVKRAGRRKASQVSAAQDSRSGSLASEHSHSFDSLKSLSVQTAPNSPCFPFLNTKKPKQHQEQPRKRGSVSFSTWLSKSEILKAKSLEWLLAMEEIKGRGINTDCSTSPILKPVVLSPEIKSNDETSTPVRVNRISLNLSQGMETVREHPAAEHDFYCPQVDNDMPYTIVSRRSSVRWPPAPLRDTYATTYNPPQFPRISFS